MATATQSNNPVNERVLYPSSSNFLTDAIEEGYATIRHWLYNIRTMLDVHGIEGRESTLLRGKDLAEGWSLHTNTLKSYKSLWMPVRSWLHVDCMGMACAFLTVCCMHEDVSRLRIFTTMENNTKAGWYLNEEIGKWRETTEPHGGMHIGKLFNASAPSALYLDLRWCYNGLHPKTHMYVSAGHNKWCEVGGRRLLLDIITDNCLSPGDVARGYGVYRPMIDKAWDI